MADLTAQTVPVVGTQLTAVTPTASVGDWVPVGARVRVQNGSGGSINVTLVVPGNDAYGTARPDKVVAVANGQNWAFGPMPQDMGDSSHSNMVNIICSAVSSVILEVTS